MPPTPTNPVATNHPDYAPAAKKWKRCRDACAGSDAIKSAGTAYLPALSAHKGMKGAEKYEAYKSRALWYNASRRTRIGLSGAATTRPPKIITDDSSKHLAGHVKELIRSIVDEQLEVGRLAIVINQNGQEEPTAQLWWAENIVNWRWKKRDGKNELRLLVLEADEKTEENEFADKVTKARHVYLLGERGMCEYEKWILTESKDWLSVEQRRPILAFGGRPLNHIPAIIVSAMSVNEEEIEDPLLLDLVDVNISHYQNSADLEHGRHWTALPTAVAVGFPAYDRDGNPIEFAIGGENAWISEVSGASASYLEFSGAGLSNISSGMQDKQAMMAVLGARLLEEAKSSVEASETIKTRLTGERSVLSRLTQTSSQAATWTLRELLIFKQPGYEASEDKDRIDLQNDFLRKGLSPAELSALTATLQAGGISYQTYFQQLQGAEIIPDERTIEEETTLIDAGNPGPKPPEVGFGQDKEETIS